jgi:hypothetical protein
MSAEEYRDYAEECMGWAKTARSHKERVTFLEMAKTWLQAAVLAERTNSPSANGATPPPLSISSGIEQIGKDR